MSTVKMEDIQRGDILILKDGRTGIADIKWISEKTGITTCEFIIDNQRILVTIDAIEEVRRK